MLNVERRVVGDLLQRDDLSLERAVQDWVDGTLRVMPEPLRLGVVLQSAALAGWAAVVRPQDLRRLLQQLERSPIPLLRSYPRLFRSLVLFAETELDQGALP